MLIPVLLACVAIALLAATLVPRLTPATQVLGVVVIGYVFGHDFWHADAGPIPLTLDRLALAGVMALFLGRLALGKAPPIRLLLLDWLIAGLCGWLTVSCLLHKPGSEVELPTSPLFRLVVSFWAPACLYAVMRTSVIGATAARRTMIVLACLGFYLGVTALLEMAGVWSLVFPRYVADPELGLHFGRARGPALNSVSLGAHLAICAAAAWLLIPRASRAGQLSWLGGVVLMSLGVGLSFTRSTYVGLALAGVTVACLQLPREWRRTAFVTAGVAGLLLFAFGKEALVNLKREDSGAVSAHSVQQRAAFAYVSGHMISDHPLWGVGFGRFYDKKLPYLTDRRQSFELESLRTLHHHNTLLSVLVETGPVGLALFVGVLVSFGVVGWRLAHDPGAPPDCRNLGLLLIAAVLVYASSAVFHDLTLIHSEQWLLFTIAGAATGCWLNRGAAAGDAPANAHALGRLVAMLRSRLTRGAPAFPPTALPAGEPRQ